MGLTISGFQVQGLGEGSKVDGRSDVCGCIVHSGVHIRRERVLYNVDPRWPECCHTLQATRGQHKPLVD